MGTSKATAERAEQAREPSRSGLRVVRPPRAAPSEAARVTRAEINLARVRHNLRELRSVMTNPAEGAMPAAIWAVLKADGYGHGARNLATTLEQAGVDGVCVALLEEGIELRNAGITVPILVMGGYYGRYRDGIEALIEHRLTPVVYDVDRINAIASTARYMNMERVPVHLKVDTGMARLGVRPEGLDEVLTTLKRARDLELAGLMTHLACADSATLEATEEQMRRFETITQRVHRAGLRPVVRHAANSAAMLRSPSTWLDVVRPGIALCGVHPCGKASGSRHPRLHPVMRVITEVVAMRQLGPGESVGYGHSWTAKRDTTLATIPMGYADGLCRSLSNRGHVLIGGKRAPIVGNVSMDLTTVDVTDIPGAAMSDEVVVLGEQKGRHGSDCISAEELAELTHTISWEYLTSISRRVPRFYRMP